MDGRPPSAGPCVQRATREHVMGDPTGPSVADLLRDLARRGTASAVVEADSGRRYDAAGVAAAVAAEATRRRAEHPDGGTVALSAPNGAAWLRTMLGAMSAGLTVATINPLGTPADVADQVRRTRARRLVCDTAVAQRARDALPPDV